MSETMKDITAVLMAIVGVAIVAVLVSNRNNTVGVLNSATGGFSSILGTAMGAASGPVPMGGFSGGTFA